MISKEELFLGLAVTLLFIGPVSFIVYVALGDALKNFQLKITQRVVTLRKGSMPRRRRGLRRIK